MKRSISRRLSRLPRSFIGLQSALCKLREIRVYGSVSCWMSCRKFVSSFLSWKFYSRGKQRSCRFFLVGTFWRGRVYVLKVFYAWNEHSKHKASFLTYPCLVNNLEFSDRFRIVFQMLHCSNLCRAFSARHTAKTGRWTKCFVEQRRFVRCFERCFLGSCRCLCDALAETPAQHITW